MAIDELLRFVSTNSAALTVIAPLALAAVASISVILALNAERAYWARVDNEGPKSCEILAGYTGIPPFAISPERALELKELVIPGENETNVRRVPKRHPLSKALIDYFGSSKSEGTLRAFLKQPEVKAYFIKPQLTGSECML